MGRLQTDPPVPPSYTMFLSMMSEEGRSSFLIGEGGGVAVLALGFEEVDT